MTEREAYIALNMMERVGPVGVRAMASLLGSARAIFDADANALMQARGVGRELAATIMEQRGRVAWSSEVEKAEAAGAHLVTPVDPEYPEALRNIHDPPLALYAKGELATRDRHAIAVVGTRRPTHYGRETAEKLGFQLSKAGFTVVSGLAEGIDTAAHRGALKAAGRTLAVMGSGLDHVYPASNRQLAEEIAGHGVLMTEFPFGRQPDKTTFPMRNRIVSGLCMGVVVVEAGVASGALITARQAMEQGRTVFAVPGRIDCLAARGPHGLLRDGAVLVESVDDITAEYGSLFPRGAAADEAARRPAPILGAEESRLVELLKDGSMDVDALIRAAAYPASAVNALLIGLEMKRVVRMLPGRVVELVTG